jgi:hypothetical protein
VLALVQVLDMDRAPVQGMELGKDKAPELEPELALDTE